MGSLRSNFRLLQLLRQGQLTRGVLKNKKATQTEINDQTVYAYDFEFHHRGQIHIAKGRSHKTHLLEDEEHERILFLPSDPSYNIVYDAYPYAPKISKQGDFKRLPLRVYGGLAIAVFWALLIVLLIA